MPINRLVNPLRWHPLTALLAATLLAVGGVAQAAPKAAKNVDPLRLQYERERANCMS